MLNGPKMIWSDSQDMFAIKNKEIKGIVWFLRVFDTRDYLGPENICFTRYQSSDFGLL